MRLATALLALLAFAMMAAPASAQQSYTLVCRGGGNMNVSVGGGGSLEPGRPLTLVSIDFARYPLSATEPGSPVPMGACAWLDRPLNEAEPTRLLYEAQNTTAHVSLRAEGGSTPAYSGRGFTGDGAPDLGYLLDRIFSNQEFRVEVYNTGLGHMKITRVQR